jgi:organic hydroperoxide reductase OsmC/OhrA
MAIENAIYTARAKAMGGRVGAAKSDDGQIDLKLDRPVEMAVKGMAPTQSNCLPWATQLVSSGP